jgi:hypothetical protein
MHNAGGNDFDSATSFIRDHFVSCNKEPTRAVFTHLTCATDTTNIRFVFAAVKTSIILKNMKMSGML